MTFDAQPVGLARSECLRELGRGSRTIVELIFDPERDHVVACKRWGRASAETRFRLKQQFRKTSQVNHPNVVRLYDLLIEPDETCLIMEAIDGVDAAQYLSAAVAPDTSDTRFVATALRLLRQLTEALLTLHSAGIVHRDVKPRNVMVEATGRLVLLDAGFAWPPEEPFAPLGEFVARDTLPYLAPECLRGALPSAEADWYGFGAVAFALLTGRAPFEGGPAALLRVKERPIPSLCESRPSIPLALDDLVRALLQRDPRARPTGTEVEALLAELSRAEPFDVTTHAWPSALATSPELVDDGERSPRRESGLSERVVPVTRELEPQNDNADSAVGAPQLEPLGFGAEVAFAIRNFHAGLETSDEGPSDALERADQIAVAISGLRAAVDREDETRVDVRLIVTALNTAEAPADAAIDDADATEGADAFFEPDPPRAPSEPAAALVGEVGDERARNVVAVSGERAGDLLDYLLGRDENENQHLEIHDRPNVQADLDHRRTMLEMIDRPSPETERDGERMTLEIVALPVVETELDEECMRLEIVGLPAAAPELDDERATLRMIDQAIAQAVDEEQSSAGQRNFNSVVASSDVAAHPQDAAATSGASEPTASPSAARSRSVGELANRVLALFEDADAAPVVVLRGAAASDQAGSLGFITERLRQREGWLVLTADCDEHADPFDPFRSLLAQLPQSLPTIIRPFALEPYEANALLRMFPELTELVAGVSRESNDLPLDPQRQCIDAFCALRKVLIGLAGRRRVLLCLGAWHAIQPDAARLLQCLLGVEPRPRISWLLGTAEPGALPETMTLLLDRVRQHSECALTVLEAELDLDESSSPTPAPHEREASAEFATLRPRLEVMLQAAEAATERLALQRAAEWQRRALELTSSPELIRASAVADTRAGRLRDAAQQWLQLARTSQDVAAAQRYESAAGASLLRAGDEERGRALLDDVLRANGERRPRLPLMASALERARMVWQRKPSAGALDPAGVRHFDALWGAAKELSLLDPTASDALALRALRRAQGSGDASRTLWALGWQACCEANVGGAYLRGRARNLCVQTAAFAAESGEDYDRAYATSVPAIVAWFSGEWSRAETLLRDALRQYAGRTLATAHEQDVLSNFLVAALEAQGKIAALNRLLPELRIAAQQTGHQLAELLCILYEAGLPALAADRPLQAIMRADALLAGMPNDAFGPVHFQHFVVTASARLYAGHSAQAFQQTEQTWRRLRHGFWPHLDAIAVMLHQLRARAALALAAESAPAEATRLSKLAAAQAEALGRSSLPHAAALRFLIDANLAAIRGERTRAHVLCREAAVGFERAGMPLLREVCNAARAALAHTDQASHEAAHSRARLRQLGVHEPRAMAAAWFPSLRGALMSG
jgi:serine/threonine protein kinase